jgi:hypothetical protein
VVPFNPDFIDMLHLSHDVFDFSTIDSSTIQSQYQQPADTSWSQPSEPNARALSPGPGVHVHIPPTNFDSPNGEKEKPHSDIQPSEDAKLEETIMFLVVLIFLRDIGELRSLTSKRYKLYPAQQEDQHAFHREAQNDFFEPCSRHRSSRLSAFRALVSVAEMFTRCGYLQSIAEIKQYLTGVAAVSANTYIP